MGQKPSNPRDKRRKTTCVSPRRPTGVLSIVLALHVDPASSLPRRRVVSQSVPRRDVDPSLRPRLTVRVDPLESPSSNRTASRDSVETPRGSLDPRCVDRRCIDPDGIHRRGAGSCRQRREESRSPCDARSSDLHRSSFNYERARTARNPESLIEPRDPGSRRSLVRDLYSSGSSVPRQSLRGGLVNGSWLLREDFW